MAQPRVNTKISMGLHNENFTNAGKRLDLSLQATSGRMTMRSNSADSKIKLSDKLMSKPAQTSSSKVYESSKPSVISSRMDSKFAHAAT